MAPSDLWAGNAGRRGERPPRAPRGPLRPVSEERTALEEAPVRRIAGALPNTRASRALALAALIVVAAGALLAGALLGAPDDADRAAAAPLTRAAGQTDVGRVYATAGPAVASVQVAGGAGTGFLVDEGVMVTNAHVVGDAERVRVRFGDGARPLVARVLGSDPSSDLAALEVDADALRGVRPLGLAASRDVQVGDDVVAIGNPLGLDRTATAGIVSGLGREITAPNGFQIDEVIQTDAPINPGNSGGPLLDARGRVIGVNAQIATAGARGNIGIGFAVPANTLRDVLPQLQAGQRVRRPFLGVTTAPAAGGAGAAVVSVTQGGPADRAGLEAGDDVIVGVDGRPVRGPDDVLAAVADRRPGETVQVIVESGGDRRDVSVELGTRPERASGAPGP